MFGASWSPDDTLTIAAAGSKGSLQIWDVSTNGGARRTLSGKAKEAGKLLREKEGDGVVGLLEDNEDDTDAEDGE